MLVYTCIANLQLQLKNVSKIKYSENKFQTDPFKEIRKYRLTCKKIRLNVEKKPLRKIVVQKRLKMNTR